MGQNGLEYVLGEASLASLRWGKMVQTPPRYGSAKVHTPDLKNASCVACKGGQKGPGRWGSDLRVSPKELV